MTDCTNSEKTPSEIANQLLHAGKNLQSVINASKPICGRWVVIWQKKGDSFIFTDPCGQRKVYYTTNGGCIICGSQPNLINQIETLEATPEKEIMTFRQSDIFLSTESKWYSTKTEFNGCYHILPNHFLELNNKRQIRFFPSSEYQISDNQDAQPASLEVAGYLKNIMNGICRQFTPKIALTSGFDSRLLLAASSDIAERPTFFVNRRGVLKRHHDDIYIPKKLAKKFNLNLEIVDSKRQIPEWYSRLIEENIYGVRLHIPKGSVTLGVERLNNWNETDVLINGNITEIVRITKRRTAYDPILRKCRNSRNAEILIQLNSSYKDTFLINEISKWESTINSDFVKEAYITDLFYWEMEMGNWCALTASELEIATEQISPFNCRLFLETCLKVPRKQRMHPEYYLFNLMIQSLWPEVLCEPINPGPKGFGWWKQKSRNLLPVPLTNKLMRIRKIFFPSI